MDSNRAAVAPPPDPASQGNLGRLILTPLCLCASVVPPAPWGLQGFAGQSFKGLQVFPLGLQDHFGRQGWGGRRLVPVE